MSPAFGLQYFKIQDTEGDSFLFSTGDLTFPNISGTPEDVEIIFPEFDAHLSNDSLHYLMGDIDHTALLNIGSYSHTAIDSHIDDSTLHFTEASIDHTALLNIGSYSHTAIDSHIDDCTLHFTEASIDHSNIQGAGFYNHSSVDAHINSTSNPHGVTAEQAGALSTSSSTSDLSEGSNLYYTESRVSANTDVSANTTHRNQTDIHVPVFDNVSTATDTLWSSQYLKDYIDATGGSGFTLTVDDGSTSVSPVSDMTFDAAGFTVTDNGSGSITVSNLGGNGGNTSMITADTTIYVATTGSDTTGDGTSGNPFASPHKALESIGESLISSNATVTIQLADGHYSFTETITPTHMNGDRIEIVGENTHAITLNSIQSSSGSAGAYSVILNVSDVSNVIVGDYVIVRNTSGGTNPTYIAGVWKVTNVDSGNTTVSTTHGKGVPSGAVTGDVVVLKSILSFTGVHGVSLVGKTIGLFDKLLIAGTGYESSEYGIYAFTGNITTGDIFGVSSFQFGVAMYGGSVGFLDSITVSSCDRGLHLDGSQAQSISAISSGNNWGNFASTNFSSLDVRSSLSSGAGFGGSDGNGYIAHTKSYIFAYLTIASGNKVAYKSKNLSYLLAVDHTITGNTTNYSPSYGTTGNNGAYVAGW